MMASMVVARRTLLAFVAVLQHSCVDGWRHRPPPSVLPSSHQRRPLRNLLFALHNRPCMLRESPSQLRRLVCIRGGEDDCHENVVASSSTAVLEKDPEQQGPPSSSMGVPILFDLPPKIPRVFLPERPTPLDGGEISTSTTPGTETAHPHQRIKVLILMDSFCEVHGQFLAERARDAYGVATLPVYSDYMRGYFLHLQPDDRPENMEETLSMCMLQI